MARRAGMPLDLDRFDELARRIPVLANIRPSGAFLMEDFFYAGGCAALLARAGRLLDLDCPHRQRPDARREHRRCKVFNDEVIRPLDRPRSPGGDGHPATATSRPTVR